MNILPKDLPGQLDMNRTQIGILRATKYSLICTITQL